MVLADIVSGFMTWANSIVVSLGYLGIFLVNLIGSASIFLPVPAFAITFAMGAVLNPWLVGISAAIGCALGELSGYAIGLGGGEIIKRKTDSKWLAKARKLSERHGVFPVIVLFAATPLPDDVVGIIAGVIKYDIRKFFMASFIGKLIMNLGLAWGGFYGAQWALQFFGGIGV